MTVKKFAQPALKNKHFDGEIVKRTTMSKKQLHKIEIQPFSLALQRRMAAKIRI
jgi:hypothetical protein